MAIDRTATLLVLGSKPDPALPPRATYQALACANASGFSAAAQGLPTPAFTVMSAILTSGIESGRQSLKALAGLRTDTLYFYPRPTTGGSPLKRVLRSLKILRTHPFVLRWHLARLHYHYNHFVAHPHQFYEALVRRLCGHDPTVLDRLDRKQPSTGAVALLLGISQHRYHRYVLSGFSFELTHAYADNPEVAQRGTQRSRHTETDVAIMGCLSEQHGNIYTTEHTVHERTGIPLFRSAERAEASRP